MHHTISILLLLVFLPSVTACIADDASEPGTARELEMHVTTPEDLIDDSLYQWAELEPGVWSAHGDDHYLEVAFGDTALVQARNRIEKERAALAAKTILSSPEEVRLAELDGMLDDLTADTELKAHASTPICWGTASFTTEKGWHYVTVPYAQMRTEYTEFGPLSGGIKIAYASVEIGGSGHFGYDDASSSAYTRTWRLVSETEEVSIGPTFACDIEYYGYVRVIYSNGCSDMKSYRLLDHCY